MKLGIKLSLQPMEAQRVGEIPQEAGWQYEPKWDGFRCLVFRDGAQVELQSKSGQRLTRYFPEVVERLLEVQARKFVLDGELVVSRGKLFSFEQLLQRIHPAVSRVHKLAVETPATLVVFDLLCDASGKSLLPLPLRERRQRLEAFANRTFGARHGIRLSPVTRHSQVARRWLARRAGGMDGVMAKRLDAEYRPGKRTAMQKIKPRRTADCVVGGFRYAAKKRTLGSLLLGLFDDQGLLHHVGFCSGFKTSERDALARKVEKLEQPPGFTGRAPGRPSRWSNERSAEWVPLKASLVAEVEFDHVSGGRFRHGTRFVRWRKDKKPQQCKLDQLD